MVGAIQPSEIVELLGFPDDCYQEETEAVFFSPVLARLNGKRGRTKWGIFLSYLLKLTITESDEDGWISCSHDRAMCDLVLTKDEVDGAYLAIVRGGFAEKRRSGFPATTSFRLDLDFIADCALRELCCPTPTYKKHEIPPALRQEVFRRDGFACRHCGSTKDLCCDHIIAESRGGPATLSNLQVLCRPCNTKKGTK